MARDLGPARYEQRTGATRQESLLTAINRGLGGDPYHAFLPQYTCPQYESGWKQCVWEHYASMMIRHQCKEADEHVEMANSYQTFQALQNISSIPHYDPFDESRANETSTPLVSFKNATFITLSNLRSHTGPWTSDKECHPNDKHGCQITEEALARLGRFTSLVVNPVGTTHRHEHAFNQTVGTLLDFHIIFAELGISGHYENSKLEWIDLQKKGSKRGSAPWTLLLRRTVSLTRGLPHLWSIRDQVCARRSLCCRSTHRIHQRVSISSGTTQGSRSTAALPTA